ncbi:MAG: DUF3604 domain-containing protein [Acidobacteria bacterium]|nr:DUF3604 domain-containing protein [Acidobacteriota bacterium]
MLIFGLAASAPMFRSRAGARLAGAPAKVDRQVAFRVAFGCLRAAPANYDGSVTVTGGKLISLSPWRFFGKDEIQPPNSWRLETKRAPMENQPNAPVRVSDGAALPLNLVPAGLIVTVDHAASSAVVHTAQGSFTVAVQQLRYGAPLSFIGGDVSVERVPAVAEHSTGLREQHDYPSLAITRGGAVWVAWQAYRDRGDHVYVRPWGGSAERLTSQSADIFGTAIAEDAQGKLHVIWSERSGAEWHLLERLRQGGSWTPRRQITSANSPNAFHKLAASPAGRLWLVWVGYEKGESYLYTSRWEGNRWTDPVRTGGPSVWAPDAAVDRQGNLVLAWDSYAAGNYDIYCRRVTASGEAGPVERITSSPRFEAHASVAIDPEDRPWVAWDESGANWGKDWSHEDQNRGTTLYADRSIRVAVRDAGKWKQAGEFSAAVPERIRRYAEIPHLAFDGAGRPWLLFQARTSAESTHDDIWATGGLWDLYLTSYDHGRWLPAAFVPRSTARPEAPFRIAGGPDGVWMAWATDGRTFRGKSGNHELPSMVHYDIYTAHASLKAPAGTAVLGDFTFPTVRAQRVHPNESADVARIRAYRVTLNGTRYRILRGDFHRHTEISYDGAGDGSLEDYFRYMLDGAGMDTGIIGDHNMGGDVEYSWWRTEKSYDLFNVPGRFTPLFGYERSVRYPNGHRNVVFDHRGVRTLPVRAEENRGSMNSGVILFPYLRQNRGICMDHSMATGQGTDYRDNDPELEPLVEIYQGYHASYEYAGAPRAESESRQLTLHGPFQPAGFWWNALAKGLRLGVHASSDHISTHCSYAMILTPSATRADIVEGMRKRHAYAATDNIVLDFQAEGEQGLRHMMGDDFAFRGRPVLHGKIVGTVPVVSLQLIRNNEFVYTQRPNARECEFTYIDQSPRPGDNWYYVRVLQQDGNLAWSSPIWIRR